MDPSDWYRIAVAIYTSIRHETVVISFTNSLINIECYSHYGPNWPQCTLHVDNWNWVSLPFIQFFEQYVARQQRKNLQIDTLSRFISHIFHQQIYYGLTNIQMCSCSLISICLLSICIASFSTIKSKQILKNLKSLESGKLTRAEVICNYYLNNGPIERSSTWPPHAAIRPLVCQIQCAACSCCIEIVLKAEKKLFSFD